MNGTQGNAANSGERSKAMSANGSVDTLGQIAVETATRAALEFLRAHDQEADNAALAECLRSWCKAKLPGALHDAREAIEAGIGQVAEATFRASMAQAGIEAAKEAGFPRGFAHADR